MTQVEYFFPVFRKSNCVIVIFLSAGDVWRPPVRPPAAATSGHHNSDVSICEPGYERVKQEDFLLALFLYISTFKMAQVRSIGIAAQDAEGHGAFQLGCGGQRRPFPFLHLLFRLQQSL
jgi:hypothetical protein